MNRFASPRAVFAGMVTLSLVTGSVPAWAVTDRVSLADLVATVDHPLVPLATVPTKVFTGEELDPETGETIAIRVEETVLPRTEQVAGVDVTVVDVDDYHNGEFVKTTADYFAQGPDGTVYYLGERVDEYENGKIVGHEGAWLTGVDSDEPGLFMPTDPVVGDVFYQERIPGVAEERSTVIAIDQTVITPAGTFDRCTVTEDFDIPEGPTEHKSYCPGVGLVREDFPDGYIELIEFDAAA